MASGFAQAHGALHPLGAEMQIAHAIPFRRTSPAPKRGHAGFIVEVVACGGTAAAWGNREATASVDLRFRSVILPEQGQGRGISLAERRLRALEPFAIVLAGMTRPVARVVNDVGAT